jgi:hypothetical protein
MRAWSRLRRRMGPLTAAKQTAAVHPMHVQAHAAGSRGGHQRGTAHLGKAAHCSKMVLAAICRPLEVGNMRCGAPCPHYAPPASRSTILPSTSGHGALLVAAWPSQDDSRRPSGLQLAHLHLLPRTHPHHYRLWSPGRRRRRRPPSSLSPFVLCPAAGAGPPVPHAGLRADL